MKKRKIIFGAGGFIGSHLVKRLKDEGYFVRGVDLKYPEFSKTKADEFIIADLRNPDKVDAVLSGKQYDELFVLAADMGGAGFVFTGENDTDIMHNSAMINLNSAYFAAKHKVGKVFFSSSGCVYPQELQYSKKYCNLREVDAIPANCDSLYGWEKLFSEMLYKSYADAGLFDIAIARFHNIMGEEGTFEGGREKAPAAVCRKIIEAQFTGKKEIEIWGTGKQTRSFLYIDDCINAVLELMETDYMQPVNIGYDKMISITELAKMFMKIAGVNYKLRYTAKQRNKPQGVLYRNSDNTLIYDLLTWRPENDYKTGLTKIYKWMKDYIENRTYIYERNPDTNEIKRRPV